MSVVRVGIFGAGQAGGRHAVALARQPEAARVAYVVDPDKERGAALAGEVGAAWLPEATPAFWRGVDAVSVCPPHPLLAPLALDAVAFGKHLLLEKPMALTLADADAIIAGAKRAGVVLMVGFVHRFRTEVMAAHRHIRAGEIGTPRHAVEQMIQGAGARPGWVWRREAGGGVLFYSGIHGVDRLRWLLGSEAVSVSAQMRNVAGAGDAEDTLHATITYANEAVATVTDAIAPYPLPAGWTTDVYGTEGAVLLGADHTASVWRGREPEIVRATDDDRFVRETAEFLAAVREGREPAITGADGRAALATALALHASARSGQPVPLTAIEPASSGAAHG